jgi:stalled ribosome alternative rescue factor ArfA
MPKDSHPMAMLNTAILCMEKESIFRKKYDEGMKNKGSYMLQWRMIQWLKENVMSVVEVAIIPRSDTCKTLPIKTQ